MYGVYKSDNTGLSSKMRQFIWIERQDRREILCYVIFVIVVTAVTSLLFHVSRKIGGREWGIGVARLDPEIDFEPINDFYRFPCHPKGSPSLGLKLHGGCVRTINKGVVKLGIRLDERCLFLPIAKKPVICTYKPLAAGESLFIHSEGLKHKKEIEAMVTVLSANRTMAYFDVSSGDGAFCLAAAFTNNNTVCMNGNYRTLVMLFKSLVNNRMVDNATFIWNVLTDKHKTSARYLYKDVNVAKERRTSPDDVYTSFSSWYISTLKNEYKVNGVTLDDLPRVFKDRSVFMRLELDSTNVTVLLNGERFFRVVDVRILHVMTSYPIKPVPLAEVMLTRGFKPYSDVFKVNALGTSEQWPNSVYFVK